MTSTHCAGNSGSGKAPWDLSLMPNYDLAYRVDTVSASEISEKEFLQDYVSQNRPCLIVGAAAHWPAFANWSSIEYLKQHIKNDVVDTRSTPLFEYPITESTTQDAIEKRNVFAHKKMPFHQFLGRASTESGQLVVHSVPLHSPTFGTLLQDIGEYRFLAKPKKSRSYVPMRAFFYRDSYTDWHYHPFDEALMTQVVGDKEVLLLPPDDRSWAALDPVVRTKGYLYDINLNEFPAVADLRPYRVKVRAGDALYIPVYWWHAVGSADDKFGITVAATFGSPLHVAGNLRYPIARLVAKSLLSTPWMPLMVLAVSYSYVHRFMSIFTRRRRKEVPYE
jgi:quercetin dioxygenase-like cupin family protein